MSDQSNRNYGKEKNTIEIWITRDQAITKQRE